MLVRLFSMCVMSAVLDAFNVLYKTEYKNIYGDMDVKEPNLEHNLGFILGTG